MASDEQTELTIPRPYGGSIVLRSNEPVPAFFAWAKVWFSDLPWEMPLIATTPEDQARRESTLATDQGRAFVPYGVRVEGVYLPAAGNPPRSLGDTYRSVADIERRGITNFIVARDVDRTETPTGLALPFFEGDHVAYVEMRQPSSAEARQPLSEADITQIRVAARELSTRDDDIIDILIDHLREYGVDADGYAEIALEDIVEVRQRGVGRRKAANGVTHRDGIPRAVTDEIYDRLLDLERLHVYTGPAIVRGRPALDYARLFTIRSVRLDAADSTHIVGVRYQFSRAGGNEISAPTRLLRLDSRRQAPLKKLGRYLLQRAGEADASRRIIRTVRQILDELNRDYDPKRVAPKKSRKWLEATLSDLVSEQIISRWGYMPDGSIEPRLSRTRYGWLDEWLALEIAVELLETPFSSSAQG